MFMDLLVLADSDGVVDMTPDAISRRANVPIEEVVKYIGELSKPDELSRSKTEDGRRLIPVDPNRPWGWQIVNYKHYRKIRDEEARRSYFREKQQEHRAKKKKAEKQSVKDALVDNGGHCQTVPSASSSASLLFREAFEKWTQFRKGLGKKPKDWEAMFAKQAEWLLSFGEPVAIEMMDQSIRNGWQGLFELKTAANGQTPWQSAAERKQAEIDRSNRAYRARKLKEPAKPEPAPKLTPEEDEAANHLRKLALAQLRSKVEVKA